MPVKQVSATGLKAKIEQQETLFLLDVREPFEFSFCRIEGSVSIPLNQIPSRLKEIEYDKEVIVICHHGVRSQQAANFLVQVGFKNVSNLSGGVDAWSLECDSSIARY